MKTELRGKTLVITPTLEATCHHVGERLGLRREPDETTQAYRARLIATGEVARIEAGVVTLPGVCNVVTMQMGFSMGELPVPTPEESAEALYGVRTSASMDGKELRLSVGYKALGVGEKPLRVVRTKEERRELFGRAGFDDVFDMFPAVDLKRKGDE